MKKILMMIAVVMVLSLTACSEQTEVAQPTAEPTEQTETEQQENEDTEIADWEYDQATKTLFVNTDMGAFEPDAPDFDGTTSNAPWAEYLPEIENIVVSDDVTYIGDYAFAFCQNLKNVEAGNNIGALDCRCFFKCGDWDNDSNIDFHFNSTPSYGDDVFGYTWDNPNVMIYVPDDMKEYWAEYIMQKGEMKLDGYELKMQFSREDVLFSSLMNPQELWAEGSGGFAENQGGEFGGGASEKKFNENEMRLEMLSDDNGACVPFNTSIMTCMSDVGKDKTPQQAVMIKFSASNARDIRFSFEAMDEISFSFRDDGIYFVDVANFFEMPITDFMPNNLEIKDDTIYYFFFAFDAEGNIRMFIWEEGLAENQAYFEYDLYQESNDINNSDLKMYIGFGANGQFNIYEYWVYTFDSFMDGMPYVVNTNTQSNDMQDGNNDYGPSWNINIAGNFDIMSDMVWQSVELQDIDADGDTYAGYNLAEMMNFSGNGQDNAMIVFGQQGVDGIEVHLTQDAYIVFKKNDEFLDGPYLLNVDGLSEYPVIEVQTDY